LASCPAGSYFQPGVSVLANYQVVLSGANNAEGLTVGEDGDLYVTDSAAQKVFVFARRRNVNQNIIIPNCAQTPDAGANCTSFAASPTGTRTINAPTADVLDAIFTVPGEAMVALFNRYTGATPYTGYDLKAATSYSTSEYFSFYQPSLATNPPLYGRSALPGLLFDLGTQGLSYTKYAQSAETASDGGSFIVCPNNPSEDCQLFARVCKSDADCAAIVPGTRCNLTAPVPYCSSTGEARDDYARVQRQSSGNIIDVLANDSRSESSCMDPVKLVVSLKGASGPIGSTITTAAGGSVTITAAGANVTYSAPSQACGFIDSFEYTANLGGGVLDSATVRVLVRCVCGDGYLDPGEQCDLGNSNGPVPARCGTSCAINIVCGDGYIDPGEACDDGNTTSGDGCSARCTLESVCGDHTVEGVEECDDGNIVGGDACNPNCTLPICGDGNDDVQPPFSEQCDLGLNNSNAPSSSCSSLCQVIAHCGNSHVELGEQCDDGNVVSGDGCSSLCTVEAKCGNGTLDSGEECDPNVQATQCGGQSACTSACFCANYCGDARIGGTEQCDDGNATTGDGCRPDCTAELCGDGILDASEQCDDGNNIATDKCTNNCMFIAICGDHILDPVEQCDDGNQLSGDGCTSTCKLETTVCGNGKLESGEQCDDGNTVAGDGCSSSCGLEAAACGDGKLQSGEQCDDGNTIAGDGCDSACRFEGCGDGIKVSTEDCDDGNRTGGDGCSALCQFELL
jgi:cysteine-rich repeat protein